ncbi:MAG TPA: hypothetical protein ENN09_04465 [Planctomycetes bacterium]|nr:hypothetical protein [Planctomycetota bacterium]
MLKARLLAGGCLGFAFIAGLYCDIRFKMDCCFLVFLTAGSAVVVYELYRLCTQRGLTPFIKFGIVMSVVLMLLRWLALQGTLPMLLKVESLPCWLVVLFPWAFRLGLATSVLGALWLQATKRDNAATFESISTTLFGLLYVVFLGGFMLDIRRLAADGVAGGAGWHAAGALFLFSTVGVTKLCDVGAFTFGMLFGRHKLIPRISPKKTYEGAIGGLLFGVLIAVLFFEMGVFPLPNLASALIFAVVISVVGQYGDLAESLLKRGSGMKDSGKIVPGFGGLLDVIDSLLVSAPFAYVLLVIMLV